MKTSKSSRAGPSAPKPAVKRPEAVAAGLRLFHRGRHDRTESHTLSVIVDNEPGVLARVIGLFSGRGYNIDSLTVSETEHAKHLSRITVVTTGTPMVLAQIKNQLERLVPVHSVTDLTADGRALERELALVKVVGQGEKRVEALRLADAFRAEVIDATVDHFVFEITGRTSKIEQFIAIMAPLGLIEVCRTGIAALGRGRQRDLSGPAMVVSPLGQPQCRGDAAQPARPALAERHRHRPHRARGGRARPDVHPRPDERHIRRSDVPELARLIAEEFPGREFNIEGNPDARFVELVEAIRPSQATLVPDDIRQATSDHGWDVAAHRAFLSDIAARLKGSRNPRLAVHRRRTGSRRACGRGRGRSGRDLHGPLWRRVRAGRQGARARQGDRDRERSESRRPRAQRRARPDTRQSASAGERRFLISPRCRSDTRSPPMR